VTCAAQIVRTVLVRDEEQEIGAISHASLLIVLRLHAVPRDPFALLPPSLALLSDRTKVGP